MLKKLSITLLLSVAVCLVATAQKADAVLGRWINPSGEGQVLIYKKDNKYYGKLVWLKIPDRDGKPKTDIHNPDKALQSKPELGLELLKGFTFDGDDEYEGGTIYDPKNGKTYSCKMTIKGNSLKIRGYIGISLFGRTEVWTRVK
ncbi:DUF2147 domain-containing protein [soil metagenome]|jgi:uncharacterized protein (DUF2147 family)